MNHLSYLGFKRYQPGHLLRPYVQCYWHIRHKDLPTGAPTEFMHPEGGTGIIFNFGDPIFFNGQAFTDHCLVNGPSNKTTRLILQGRVDLFGVRFYPGAGYPFFRIPLAELSSHPLNADDCSLDYEWQALWALSPSDIKGRVSCIERWLLQRVGNYLGQQSPVHSALHWLKQQNGSTPISALSDELTISSRQVERLFKLWVGLSPKQLLRMQRLHQVREQLKQPHLTSLTEAAYQAGYYDQAHFIHEFKQVVGLTPGQYRQRLLLRQGY